MRANDTLPFLYTFRRVTMSDAPPFADICCIRFVFFVFSFIVILDLRGSIPVSKRVNELMLFIKNATKIIHFRSISKYF